MRSGGQKDAAFFDSGQSSDRCGPTARLAKIKAAQKR